jgi:predicted acyl esterase
LKEAIEEGHIFAFQDIRGRFKSEGQFVMQRPNLGLRAIWGMVFA